GQAVATHDILRATPASGGQADFGVADLDQSQVRKALQEWSGVADICGADALDAGGDTLLAANPDLLEQVIEAHLIVGYRHGLASDAAVNELDAAIHETTDHRGVRDNHN